MTYRGLAASDYMKLPGLQGVHYTTIQKAIKRLPESFLEETRRILAEMTSKRPITAIVDATLFTRYCYEERIVRLKKTKVSERRLKGNFFV